MAKLESAILRGEFEFTEITVSAGLTEADFLKQSVAARAATFVNNGTHRSYRIATVSLEARQFVLVLFFSSGSLTRFDLAFEQPGETWANWSRFKQLDLKEKLSVWILEHLDVIPPHQFSWGFIDSVFDEKGGDSFILVRYERSSSEKARSLLQRLFQSRR